MKRGSPLAAADLGAVPIGDLLRAERLSHHRYRFIDRPARGKWGINSGVFLAMHIINGIRGYVMRGAAFSLPQILLRSKAKIYAGC